MTPTTPSERSRARELSNDRLTARFDELMDDYDLGQRVSTLLTQVLGADGLRGRRALDGGCGVGGVTRALVAAGADVVALDIGPNLAAETKPRCGCRAGPHLKSAAGWCWATRRNSFPESGRRVDEDAGSVLVQRPGVQAHVRRRLTSSAGASRRGADRSDAAIRARGR